MAQARNTTKEAGSFPVSQPRLLRAGPGLVRCPASVLGSVPSLPAPPPQYTVERPGGASGLTAEPSLAHSPPGSCLRLHPAPQPFPSRAGQPVPSRVKSKRGAPPAQTPEGLFMAAKSASLHGPAPAHPPPPAPTLQASAVLTLWGTLKYTCAFRPPCLCTCSSRPGPTNLPFRSQPLGVLLRASSTSQAHWLPLSCSLQTRDMCPF